MGVVIVIGAGAAGMMAAWSAARQGQQVRLLEQNEKAGKKLYITGKGRCNLTNACAPEDFLEHVCTNRKFLYSAFYGFSNEAVMRFFEESGLKLKTERGERVFPASDHASDVTAALLRRLKGLGVVPEYHAKVKKIAGLEDGKVTGVELEDGRKMEADAVIVCTGGLSYQSTGSTGDGYRFAGKAGHTLSELSPSLVPVEVAEEELLPALQGLSLKNVELTIRDGGKVLFREFGEMLFAHFGITGPLVLTASTMVQKQLVRHPLQASVDLKPALSREQLDARFLREFAANSNRQVRHAVGTIYPSRMIPVILRRSGIDPFRTANLVTREERAELLRATKEFGLTVTRLRGWNEAVITRGGVSVKEIAPDTMASRKAEGLFFAGEVLDVDAVTGGFNLQIAWSTGYAAGRGAAEYVRSQAAGSCEGAAGPDKA